MENKDVNLNDKIYYKQIGDMAIEGLLVTAYNYELEWYRIIHKNIKCFTIRAINPNIRYISEDESRLIFRFVKKDHEKPEIFEEEPILINGTSGLKGFIHFNDLMGREIFKDFFNTIPFIGEMLNYCNNKTMLYLMLVDAMQPSEQKKPVLNFGEALDYVKFTNYADFNYEQKPNSYLVSGNYTGLTIINICKLTLCDHYSNQLIVDFEKFQEILFLENNVGKDLRAYLRYNHFSLLNVKKLIIDHLVDHHNKKYNEAVHIANTEYFGKVLSKK